MKNAKAVSKNLISSRGQKNLSHNICERNCSLNIFQEKLTGISELIAFIFFMLSFSILLNLFMLLIYFVSYEPHYLFTKDFCLHCYFNNGFQSNSFKNGSLSKCFEFFFLYSITMPLVLHQIVNNKNFVKLFLTALSQLFSNFSEII